LIQKLDLAKVMIQAFFNKKTETHTNETNQKQ